MPNIFKILVIVVIIAFGHIRCNAQQDPNVKFKDFREYMQRSASKNGRPIPPRLQLNAKAEVGDIGFLDHGLDPEIERVTTKYTYNLTQRLSDNTGIIEIVSITHVPARPISAVGSPGNLRVKYAPSKRKTEKGKFFLKNYNLSSKADGNELRFSGVYVITGTHAHGDENGSNVTVLIFEQFNPQQPPVHLLQPK